VARIVTGYKCQKCGKYYSNLRNDLADVALNGYRCLQCGAQLPYGTGDQALISTNATNVFWKALLCLALAALVGQLVRTSRNVQPGSTEDTIIVALTVILAVAIWLGMTALGRKRSEAGPLLTNESSRAIQKTKQSQKVISCAEFSETYSRMSDDELRRLATDRQSLVENARQALGSEMQKRQIT
jgi:DNA-directed RNA polymerase subunit RPC12/RpoP